MNRQQILQIASKSPQFQQGVQALEQQMQASPITPKQLAELIKMMEFALSHPKSYPQIVQAAIKDGYTQPGDMPEQFDPTVIVSILAALYIVQDKMGKPQGMARGGSVDNFNAIQGLDVGGFKISPSKLHWVTTPTGRFLSGGTGPNTGYAGTGNLMADRSKFAYDPEYVDPNRAEVYSGLWLDGGAGADVDYAIKNYVMRNAFDANKDNPAEVKRLMTKYGVSASDLGAATQGMPVGSNVGSLFSQHYNPATSVPYTGQADIPKYIQDNAATFGSDFGGQHNWSNEDFAKYYNSAGGGHDSGSFDAQMKSEQWRRNAVEQLDTQKRKNDNFGNAEAWYTAKPSAMARGGLAQAARQLQSRGRHGDTMLAHINPREAMMLRQAGGSGGINPQTGLPEFFNLGKFLGAIIPIAVAVFAPYLAPAIGEAMMGGSFAGVMAGGTASAGAGMLGGALIGAGSSALSGGNVGQGALLGGLGGGLGDWAGKAANEGLSLGLGEAGAKTLGSGLVGGAAGALTGQGILQGAAQGAIGQYMGSQVGGSPGMENAGQTFGNMLTAGYDPKSAVLAGGLSGLATSFMGPSTPAAKPSDVVLDALKDPSKLTGTELTSQGELNAPASPLPKAPTPTTSMNTPGFTGSEIDLGFREPTPTTSMGTEGFQGAQSSPWNLKNAMLGMTALSMLQDAPQEVKQAVSTLSPEQKKYFNLPSVTWDWNRMQQDANKAGMSLSQFMAQSWPQITGYAQGSQNGNPSSMSGAYNKPAPPPRKLAQGGPLSQIAYMAQGSGTGRADTIDAKLSDGEYVMDAETVALLGDGSNKAGAQRLDAMRGAIRSHKGRTLAKGKFSPAAKSPLAYLKGAR